MKKIAGIIVGAFGVLAVAPSYLWVLGLEPHYYTGDRGLLGALFAGALFFASATLLLD